MMPSVHFQETDLARLRELLKLQEFPQAAALAKRVTTANPDLPLGWLILTEAQRGLGDEAAALLSARRLVELVPQEAWSHQLHALLAKRQQCFPEAKAAYQRALQLDPGDAETHCNFAAVLSACNDNEQALRYLRNAIELKPDFAAAHTNLGAILTGQGRFSEGLEAHQRALAINPNNVIAHDNLGLTLAKLHRYKEAEQAHRQALAIDPKFVPAYLNLCNRLVARGAFDEAEVSLRQAIRIQPGHQGAHSELLSLQGYLSIAPPVSLRQESERWELAVLSDTERCAAQDQRFQRSPSAGRKLRLGILSAELGQHAVAYFLLGWLKEIDRSRFELYLYSTTDRPDNKGGSAFKAIADQWRSLVGLPDESAANLLRRDRLDILLETTGHLANNRLGLVARRVAPVQCHYIGYFATTGLSEMDYFIGDRVLIPPEHDHHFRERVWRLPRTRYLYQTLESAPDPIWSPSDDGRIRLGSFNDLIKIRTASVTLWARLLQALPESCLVLKDRWRGDQKSRERLLASLRRQGIGQDRVVFQPFVESWYDFMALYNGVDVALDSVPFNSATTAFDALWMGTPLVTLLGDRLSGRQAASCLTGLGRKEWIAPDEDTYVETVSALANDLNKRQYLREHLRSEMQKSELCDARGMARALEDSFSSMFEQRLYSGARFNDSYLKY